jgi:hypothetical protein
MVTLKRLDTGGNKEIFLGMLRTNLLLSRF